MMHVLSFGIGTAVIELRNGKAVRREAWPAQSRLELVGGAIRWQTDRGVALPWQPRHEDILATDWNVWRAETA